MYIFIWIWQKQGCSWSQNEWTQNKTREDAGVCRRTTEVKRKVSSQPLVTETILLYGWRENFLFKIDNYVNGTSVKSSDWTLMISRFKMY